MVPAPRILRPESNRPRAPSIAYYLNRADLYRHRLRCGEAVTGKLATREDRRGQGIALVLGARAMVSMHERYGVSAFTTCVQANNLSSMAVCEKLGVTATDWTFVGCIDPQSVSHPSITI